jgi:hypothetical protein
MRIHVRKGSRPHPSSLIPHPSPLSQRQRYCLAAVVGGGAAVGANLGDVLAAVAAVDRNLTEREVRMLLGSLLATGLVELSGVDRARYVATPKGIEVAEL